MTQLSFFNSCIATMLLATICFTASAKQTGGTKRVLVADSSTRRLAIVGEDGKLELEIKVSAIHDAHLLPNGNILLQQGWTKVQEVTLIGAGNGYSVLEVTPRKEIVWKIEQNDLSGITLAWVTRVERLASGNTIIGNCHAGPDNPQIIEVAPDKKVLWT